MRYYNNEMQYNNYPYSDMNSYIRVFHASPNSPPVDVYINDNLVLRELDYKEFSEYLTVMPGMYNVKVYPAGDISMPVINENLSVESNTAYTIAAIGELPEISLLPIMDPYMPRPTNKSAYVRFVHLSPNAPAVDITLPDSQVLFSDIEYTEQSEYIRVNPGKYTLQVRPAGMEQVVLSIPNVNLMPGKIYTIYAVGLIGEEPPLEAIISEYIKR